MKQYFTIKDDCSYNDMCMLSPNLLLMFVTVMQFTQSRGLPLKVTSIISDRENTKAKTMTHDEGRAIDFSCAGWSAQDRDDLERELFFKHSQIAAISASTLTPRPIVYHEYMGQGFHGHLQVRR